MSTATTPSTLNAAEGRSATASFPRLLAMEWTKLRTVRSTIWSLAIMVVVTLGLTSLIVGVTVSTWDKARPDQVANIVADPVSFILGTGLEFGQLAVCVLGVLVMTSEYGTGMIRSSLLAVPTRVPMLVAKAVVLGATVLVLAEGLSFADFAIGAGYLNSKVPVALSDPGVLRAVFGSGLYLTVLSLFALSIGALVRHTAAGVTGVIAFVLVLAPLADLLPDSWGKHVHAYLPTPAGQLIGQAHQDKNDLLTPLQGFGVFCLWTIVLMVLAGYLLRKRDA